MDNWRVEDFDPRWPEFARDPYPYYRRLRTEDPVHYVPSLKMWWLTRHADTMRALSETALFRKELPEGAESRALVLPPQYKKLMDLPDSMLFRDPPNHTRLRSLVNKAFTPKVVEGMRSRIQTIASELLAAAEPRGRLDFIADFAFPLPAIVIAEMLGVPHEGRDRFKDWSDRIIRGMDGTQPLEAQLAGIDANFALLEYFEHLIAERRESKGDDFLSGLIRAEEAGDRLSLGELLTTCILLLVAGHETTTNLIANGTLTLLRHPGQLDLLRRHPELMPTAVEELLRYESPAQRISRWAGSDTVLGGKEIPKGSVVTPVMGAANRDPAVFVDPERLDITRRENPHVAFGRGIHFCLGAPLARLEAPIAFETLFHRFPSLVLEGEPTWKPETWIRGLRSMPVAF